VLGDVFRDVLGLLGELLQEICQFEGLFEVGGYAVRLDRARASMG
jgi:hypothetical protein